MFNNIDPVDRWVGEVEHFYKMVEHHKTVPYRGVFGTKPRDPQARVDPPAAEKMRAGRASKRPASAAGRHTSDQADNGDGDRSQTAPSSQAQREAVAERLYRRMLRGHRVEGPLGGQPALQPRVSPQRLQTASSSPRTPLTVSTARLSPARKVATTQHKTKGLHVAKREHVPGTPSVNPPPPRPPHLDPIRGCLSKNLRSIIASQVTVLELAELYSLQQPPKALEALMDCVCVLFGLQPSWMSAHTHLLRNLYVFHSRLLHFERNSLTLQRRLLFCKAVEHMDKHCQAIEKVNRAAVGLHEWVMCIHTYYTAPTHSDNFTEDRDPLAYLSRLLALEQRQAHASNNSTQNGGRKKDKGSKSTSIIHGQKKDDAKPQQQRLEALEPAVPVTVESLKPSRKQIDRGPSTRKTQDRTRTLPPPVSTAPHKVKTKAAQTTRQQPDDRQSPMSTASSNLDNLQAPATSAPALNAAKPPSAQENLQLPDELDAVSACGSVEADELLDPYLLSPGSAYGDEDFELSAPSTPVAQGGATSSQQDDELGLVEELLIPAPMQQLEVRPPSDSGSIAKEESKGESSGDYTLDYEEVATRASTMRQSEGGHPEATSQVAEAQARDADQSIGSTSNAAYAGQSFEAASVPGEATLEASHVSKDGSSSDVYASESFEQATAAPATPPAAPEDDYDIFNGFSVDDELASEAIKEQQSFIYSSCGDQPVSEAPGSVAYSIEAERGGLDQQNSTSYSTDLEQEGGEEQQSASYCTEVTGAAEGQTPVAATSIASYNDDGFDDESLSMIGAACGVEADGFVKATAGAEDERTQATAYEEEFEEESVSRSRAPVNVGNAEIGALSSESDVDYDINLD